MPQVQIGNLQLTSRDYLPGKGTTVKVSPPKNPYKTGIKSSFYSLESLSIQPAKTISTNSYEIILKGITPITIPRLTEIIFPQDKVIVDKIASKYSPIIEIQSPPGTTIPAYEKSEPIELLTPTMTECLSINSVNTTDTAEDTRSRNFDSGIEQTIRQINLDKKVEISGNYVLNDIGSKRLIEAINRGLPICFQVIYSNGSGFEATAYVTSHDDTTQMDDDKEFQATLNIDGQAYPLGQHCVSKPFKFDYIIDDETYIIAFYDSSGSMNDYTEYTEKGFEIAKTFLKEDIYNNDQNRIDKYVKGVDKIGDERWVRWLGIDLRDSIEEPKKQVSISFINESSYTYYKSSDIEDGDRSSEPWQDYIDDYNEFTTFISDADIFQNQTIAAPAIDLEQFLIHLNDAIAGTGPYNDSSLGPGVGSFGVLQSQAPTKNLQDPYYYASLILNAVSSNQIPANELPPLYNL